ncbi:unnamed protein product [Fusarium graminearum]|uniref:Chromosome 3, complete genome n=1 Tax=Gibberella zeae (strain ATCC MYA-4620 / CBS 123657 / FGSC 9075 / NRRL 31084 / PH-1) TaxID=229533 RepID=A0A098DYJ1_GIBZE|nr:unnamed protein product [Fusarium graminearum]CZS84409.1 unnamed protein product [Fusarium graminearum]
MPDSHDTQVLHGQDHTQNTSSSPQMERWLQESKREMPWHLPDSIVISSSQTPTSNTNTNTYTPFHNPTTQGSVK